MIIFCAHFQKQGGSASFSDVAKYPLEKLRNQAELPDGIDVLHKEVCNTVICLVDYLYYFIPKRTLVLTEECNSRLRGSSILDHKHTIL